MYSGVPASCMASAEAQQRLHASQPAPQAPGKPPAPMKVRCILRGVARFVRDPQAVCSANHVAAGEAMHKMGVVSIP